MRGGISLYSYIMALILPLKILNLSKKSQCVRFPIKMICAKFEQTILISYAGTFGSRVTQIAVIFLDRKLD